MKKLLSDKHVYSVMVPYHRGCLAHAITQELIKHVNIDLKGNTLYMDLDASVDLKKVVEEAIDAHMNKPPKP
jgi:hypothetical protein